MFWNISTLFFNKMAELRLLTNILKILTKWAEPKYKGAWPHVGMRKRGVVRTNK